jgi:electron transport complex protein RnfG
MKESASRLIIVLAVISIVAGLLLALTYNLTIPTIEANAAAEQEAAILETLPGATKYETIEGGEFPVYKGLDDNENVVGIAYAYEGGGFQGMIKVMIGIDPGQQKVTGIKILSHAETPGLGARIGEPAFQGQFAGKPLSDGFVANKDVDAITGATISSKAVIGIVKESIPKAMEVYKASGGGK